MTTRLYREQGDPPAGDCTPYQGIVTAMIELIESKSSAVDDFAGFLDPQSVHGPATLADIRRAAQFAPNLTAARLFTELEALHQSCPANDWNKLLGALVECVIERLLAYKYTETPIVREHRIEVVRVADTGRFPVDVIAWNIVLDHGEAIEVKKALRSVVNDKKLIRKLRVLQEFKTAVEARTGQPSFIGLASLLDEPTDAELYVQTMLGCIGAPLPIDLLTRDTVLVWQSQRYL